MTLAAIGSVFLFVALVSLVFAIITVVDMARRPGPLWSQAGSSKGLWLTLEIVCFLLLGFLSIIVGVLYFAMIRPRLQAAESRGGPGWSPGPTWEPTGQQWPGQAGPGPAGPWPTASYPPPAPPGAATGAEPAPPPPPGAMPPPYPGGAPAAPPAYPVEAPPPTPAPPFGWYPDPSGRHEQRYWDGTRWTEHVRDAGQDSTEALPG